MQKFKISVSKWGKKYTLVLSELNEIQARDRVHKEWYSILSIEEIWNDNTIVWHKYTFEWEKDWEIKKWKILWNDIFKVYVKLKKDLGYNIRVLYPENEESLDESWKEKIIKELEEEYNIFEWKWKKSKKEELKENIEKNRENKKELENFYLKKELGEIYKLIDFVLEKLKNLVDDKEIKWLALEQKEKIKNIYNSIVKLKKTTNIAKLKEIWEIALLKAWKLELRSLEKNQDDEARELLKETNRLLRKIGSKKQFIEKSKDVSFILSSFFTGINDSFRSFIGKIEKSRSMKIDKSSYSYIKNERLLKKYKEKLHLNGICVLKSIFSQEKREKYLLKRSVIKQNILLLLAKKKWVSFSYTFLKKGYKKILEKVLRLLSRIREYLFYILVLYSVIFLFYINYIFYYKAEIFNYNWFFYFIVLLILYFTLSLSKNLIFIVLNFSFFFFLVVFWLINF
jgi:hypothetical protein